MNLVFGSEPLPLMMDDTGTVRVGGTRVTLDTIVTAFQNGATAEEIVQQYPTVALGDMYAVIGYYLRHRAEVDAHLRERQEEAEQIRREMESRFDPKGIRDRLLARQARQSPSDAPTGR